MLRLVLPKGSLERATMELFEAADLAVRRASYVDYRARSTTPGSPRSGSCGPRRSPSTWPTVSSTSGSPGVTGSRSGAPEVVSLGHSGVLQEHRQSDPCGAGGGRGCPGALAGRPGAAGGTCGWPPSTPSSPGGPLLAQRGRGRDLPLLRGHRGQGSRHRRLRRGDHRDRAGAAGGRSAHHRDPAGLPHRAHRQPGGGARTAIKRHAMDQILTLLQGTLEARGKVLVKLNVPQSAWRRSWRCCPRSGHRRSRSSSGGGGFAVESVVPKSRDQRTDPRPEGPPAPPTSSSCPCPRSSTDARGPGRPTESGCPARPRVLRSCEPRSHPPAGPREGDRFDVDGSRGPPDRRRKGAAVPFHGDRRRHSAASPSAVGGLSRRGRPSRAHGSHRASSPSTKASEPGSTIPRRPARRGSRAASAPSSVLERPPGPAVPPEICTKASRTWAKASRRGCPSVSPRRPPTPRPGPEGVDRQPRLLQPGRATGTGRRPPARRGRSSGWRPPPRPGRSASWRRSSSRCAASSGEPPPATPPRTPCPGATVRRADLLAARRGHPDRPVPPERHRPRGRARRAPPGPAG